MLYARCSTCGYTAALTCSGQFMAHPTMPVARTAMGPTCAACGPLPPVFTCPYLHTQYLYLPGYSPAPQPGYAYAPVVQARPGESSDSLASKFGEVGGQIARGLGKGLAEGLLGGLR